MLQTEGRRNVEVCAWILEQLQFIPLRFFSCTSCCFCLLLAHFLTLLSLYFFLLAAKLPLVFLPAFSTSWSFICKQWLPFLFFFFFSLKLFCKGKAVLALRLCLRKRIPPSSSSNWLLIARLKIAAQWTFQAMCWGTCSGWLLWEVGCEGKKARGKKGIGGEGTVFLMKFGPMLCWCDGLYSCLYAAVLCGQTGLAGACSRILPSTSTLPHWRSRCASGMIEIWDPTTDLLHSGHCSWKIPSCKSQLLQLLELCWRTSFDSGFFFYELSPSATDIGRLLAGCHYEFKDWFLTALVNDSWWVTASCRF